MYTEPPENSTADDITTPDDIATLAVISKEFGRVHYTRPDAPARARSRPALLIAGGLVAAGIAAAVIIATSPADQTAFGWTAEARTPSADEARTALELCDMIRTRQGNSTAFNPNGTATPNMTLDALDLRGDIAVATLYADDFAKVCIIDTTAPTWTEGDWLVLDRDGSDELRVNAVTAVLPGTTVVFGWVPAGMSSVQLDVPGVPVFTVPTANGMFATWVPVTLAPDTGIVTGIGPDGTVISAAPIVLWAQPDGS